MTKTILVPVDLNVASLNTLKLALESLPDQKIKVLLIYPKNMDNNITDLLFLSPFKIIRSLTSHEFEEALEIIKNRYREKIVHVSTKLFLGNTTAFLKNFIAANAIDAIIIPQNYKFQIARQLFDPIPLLKKAKVPVFEVNLESTDKFIQHEQLLSLFN
jgi:hypothetical protein